MPPKAKKKPDVTTPAAAAGVDSPARDGDSDGSHSDNDDDLPDDIALLRSQFDSLQASLAPLIAFVAASAAAGDDSQPGTSTTANVGSSTSTSSQASTQLLCPYPDFLSRDQQRFDPADEYTRAMASEANVRQKTGAGAGKPNVLWQRDLFNYERWYNTVAQLQLVVQELRHVTFSCRTTKQLQPES